MKQKIFYTLVTLVTFCVLPSCEKADINLEEENIETRLDNMLGLGVSSVKNLLTSEGYECINFDNVYSFIGDDNDYTLLCNTKSPKKIYTAAYQETNITSYLNTMYITYRDSFQQKGKTSYSGTIAANYFVDLDKSYVDSIIYGVDDFGDYIYQYEYDNPDKFYTALMLNQNNLIFSSEVWWLGEMNSDKAWALQFTEDSSSTYLTLGIFCADYTIKD